MKITNENPRDAEEGGLVGYLLGNITAQPLAEFHQPFLVA